jgi:hypothetical protein
MGAPPLTPVARTTVSPPIQTARYDAGLLYKTNYTNCANCCSPRRALRMQAGPRSQQRKSICKVDLQALSIVSAAAQTTVVFVAVRNPISYHITLRDGPYYARIRPPVHRNHLGVPDSPDGNPNCCGRQFLAPAVTTLSPTMLIQSLRRLCGMDTISRQRLGGWSFPFKPLRHQSSCLHEIVCKSA